MLSPKDSFRVGFLARCADAGMTPEQTLSAVESAREKVAGVISTIAGKTMDAAKGVAGGLAGWGIPLAIAAPPMLGVLGGMGLAKATDIDDTDVEDVKSQEVTEELDRQADALRRQQAAREYRRALSGRGRRFA